MGSLTLSNDNEEEKSRGSKDINSPKTRNQQEQQQQQQIPRFSSMTSLKRPRPSTEESMPLRESIRAFGQRVSALDAEITAAVNSGIPSITFEEKIWKLVLELRPYILAPVSASVNSEIPEEMRELYHNDIQRVVKYAWLALRVYLSVTRIASSIPSILLHCTLTLLSILPIAGAPSLPITVDEKVYFKGIQHILIVLSYQYPYFFFQLIHILFREDTIGAFIFSPTPRRTPSHGRCTITISDPPSVHSLINETQNLFTSTIIAETTYEVICVASGFCNIIGTLFTSNIPLQPTLFERDVLLRVACGLLAADLHEGITPMLLSNNNNNNIKSQITSRNSGKYQQNEINSNTSDLFYLNAGFLLKVLLENGLLVKILHAPMILYTLTQHLYEKSRLDFDNYSFEWELKLLRWISDNEEENENIVTSFLGNNIENENRFLEKVEKTNIKPFNYFLKFFKETNLHIDVIRALIGCVNKGSNLELFSVANLLLKLLRDVVSHTEDSNKIMEDAFYEVGIDLVEALLQSHIVPLIKWFTEMSSSVSVLQELFSLFPVEIVTSLISEKLTLSRHNGPNDVYFLAAANASVVLCESSVMRESLLRDAWSHLINLRGNNNNKGIYSVSLDAVIILLRATDPVDVEMLALDMMELLNRNSIVLQFQEPSLRLSLLYAEIVRKLPLSNGDNCNRALELIKNSLDVRAKNQKNILWRIIGVLRGFHERILRYSLFNIINSSSLQIRREETVGLPNEIGYLTSIRELNEVFKLISPFLQIFSQEEEEEEGNNEALLLLWEQILALTTELFRISEQLRSIYPSLIKIKKNIKDTVPQSSIVIQDDDDDDDDVVVIEGVNNERSVNVSLTSDGVSAIAANKSQRLCAEEDEIILEGNNNNISLSLAIKVLREVGASLEGVGWVARQLFLTHHIKGNYKFTDILLAFICICVTNSPIRWVNMEEIVFSYGLSNSSKIIRCGYAALVLRILITRWDDKIVADIFTKKILNCENTNKSKIDDNKENNNNNNNNNNELKINLLMHFEVLEAALTGDWQTFIKQGFFRDGYSTCEVVFPLTLASSFENSRGSIACGALFDTCISIWEKNSTSLAGKSAALDVAHTIMRHMSWSVEDLCWRDTSVIYTSFFKAMCNVDERDVREVVLKSLDCLLPPSILSDDGTGGKHKQLCAFLDKEISLDSKFAKVMAYILLKNARASVEVKIAEIKKLLEFLSKRLEELPQLMNHSLASLIVSLMYLDGDRQLRERFNEENKNEINKNSSVELSLFDIAVEVALAVGECGPIAKDILYALELPLTVSTNGRARTKYVFDVLDTVAQCVGISKETTVDNEYPVSICSVQRWLCGLTSLIRFLGTDATLIAPKLPAILEYCSSRQQLVEPVCAVWRDLLANCTETYIKEHSPAIVVDLMSMEHLAKGDASGALTLLEAAMRIVYRCSAHKAFWESYFKVMGRTSVLICRLKQDANNNNNNSQGVSKIKNKDDAILSVAEYSGIGLNSSKGESNADVVVAGFLSVMHSSSTKCKEVFVRALFQYLSSTDSEEQMEMTRAAGARPELIFNLLNCACEIREEYVEENLACVGMIGALTHSNTTLISSSKKKEDKLSDESEISSKESDISNSRRDQLLPEDVLNWRLLAQKILSLHCTRALANTADPTMHDRAAFAVQQLLRVCTDTERRTNGFPPLQEDEDLHVEELQRYTWWSQLEFICRKRLEGYTTTRYSARVLQQAKPRSPVFTIGMSYHVWLNAWFCDLILRCDGVFGQMMMSLRNMAKGDHSLITFLMPHIIIHIIMNGISDHCNAVATEVNVLLKAASATTLGDSEKVSSLHSQCLMMEVVTPAAPASSIEEHVQQVFLILEDIEHLSFILLKASRNLGPSTIENANPNVIQRVVEACKYFLSNVNWKKKVEAAVAIGSNMRALRCIEGQRYLPKIQEISDKQVSLQRIFAALGDRDSSRSLHRTQEHEPEDAAFSHENNGEWSLALQACELVLQQHPDSINHQLTALHCMQQLGQLHLMSRYSQALLSRSKRPINLRSEKNEWSWQVQQAALQNYANEAAWRLAEWDTIKPRQDLPVSLALPMMSFTNLLNKKGTLQDVSLACAMQRKKIAPLIRAACRESYVHVYPHVVVLHALADIETAAKSVIEVSSTYLEADKKVASSQINFMLDKRRLQKFVSLLHQRVTFTDTTLESQELLISLHRSIFRALNMEEEVTKRWMHHAKLLRKEGFLEAALNALKQVNLVDECVDPSYYTIQAKLLHEMNMPTQAIEFAEYFANNSNISLVTRAKLRVLVTRWRQDIGYQTSQEVIAAYESVLKMNPCEKAHHYLALFYDTLYRSVEGSSQEPDMPTGRLSTEKWNNKIVSAIDSYVLRAIDHFGMALQLDSKTVTISLPRMLTLWLNSSITLSTLAADSHPSSVRASSVLRKMNSTIERYLLDSETKLPATLLIMALPQLLSRIGQGNNNVVNIITRTVVDLMINFPQQCLWQVLPIVFSKLPNRSEVARKDIVSQFVKIAPEQKKLVENMSALFKSLIELCNSSASTLTNGRSTPEASIGRQPFIQRIQSMLPSAGIILPTMANLSPNVMQTKNNSTVFAGSATFQRFDDRVVILSSLQKPKRIKVISSEGELVPFLCKSRDEPRKDMRMMEIASLMNMFFLSDPEARRKRFALRRYAVSALNDDCAIIEWVNNLSPFRKVVEECYTIDGTGVRVNQVKVWKGRVDNGSLSKIDMFEKHIFPRTRPVFHNWFHSNFLSHQDWYNARTIYTQATALWSIAGHIVGLGDRHGENLMIDLHSGELMHVDFACMFDKGETLEVPERVRFRLTQNVVDGMGVLGVDGPFRSSCQVALRCQMKNKTAVMTVVETLLHDPLVEWARQSSTRQGNFDPKRLIERVSRRLDGYLDLYSPSHEWDALALGCEGQVSKLISHSSAIENLTEMYIWWMAWL